ncbi:tRNA (adenosine(37)-N6)-threonylcarbamoyltransferase complex ATPase subunit type 1 TsaE [Caldimonas tepidiphila]|uniref:tRNA (adenosine(37)-N6)-threonylcarbamoyltransferase complex ATPase subunit type 1 TsaE n=1 Tax=Caldimonas tepidiphila TaxID=2315841 RepID=UPI000E5BCE70|nr:tRNA (adenosine(37)-N6)-threonylcarbamoyltransferase complex ATPase subunit type 1 TsaE [Caldimonas tepidiphila]
MHPPILETRRLDWPDEAACESFAQGLAQRGELRDACIELHGPLGAGKTTFVRHLLRALGATGRIKSPTYAVMEPYDLPGLKAWHFDFYRFGDPREWEDAGFRDVFASPGLKLCEWPEKAAGLMPLPDVKMVLSPTSQGLRHVKLEALTPTGVALIGSLDAGSGAR